MLSPRLQFKVAQKQILTPGLVQMVTVLQLNRLELKEMINQEIVENPVLEESTEEGEEITPEELQPLLEAERGAEPGRSVPAGRCRHQSSTGTPPKLRGMPTPLPKPRRPRKSNGRGGRGGILDHRSFRRNRFRIVFRRLSGSRAIAVRRRNRSISLLSRPSFHSPRRCPITCALSSAWPFSMKRRATPPKRSSAIWMKTAT